MNIKEKLKNQVPETTVQTLALVEYIVDMIQQETGEVPQNVVGVSSSLADIHYKGCSFIVNSETDVETIAAYRELPSGGRMRDIMVGEVQASKFTDHESLAKQLAGLLWLGQHMKQWNAVKENDLIIVDRPYAVQCPIAQVYEVRALETRQGQMIEAKLGNRLFEADVQALHDDVIFVL